MYWLTRNEGKTAGTIRRLHPSAFQSLFFHETDTRRAANLLSRCYGTKRTRNMSALDINKRLFGNN